MTDAAAAAVRVPAWAKVNLYLHVVGRRADGYHLLDSLIAFVGVGDTVEVAPAPAGELSLVIDGPFARDLPAGGDNLVVRAADLLAAASGTTAGARIRLVKRLPVASGIGGGSTDAAACLKALIRLWGIDIAWDALQRLALKLGADVPVCVAGHAAYMGGIGEQIEPAPALPPAWLVLVNPGVAVPTPAVYARRAGPFSAPARLPAEPFASGPAGVARLAALLAERGNGLTEAATALAPAIGEVLAALGAQPGVLLARMSGSGATCFGLCAGAAEAEAAAGRLRRQNPAWWVAAAPLADADADAGADADARAGAVAAGSATG
jgi:4-diphosphocytidyl-2-C-methyl-D-erythritol kinase